MNLLSLHRVERVDVRLPCVVREELLRAVRASVLLLEFELFTREDGNIVWLTHLGFLLHTLKVPVAQLPVLGVRHPAVLLLSELATAVPALPPVRGDHAHHRIVGVQPIVLAVPAVREWIFPAYVLGVAVRTLHFPFTDCSSCIQN